jgi:hypothetical protein
MFVGIFVCRSCQIEHCQKHTYGILLACFYKSLSNKYYHSFFAVNELVKWNSIIQTNLDPFSIRLDANIHLLVRSGSSIWRYQLEGASIMVAIGERDQKLLLAQ